MAPIPAPGITPTEVAALPPGSKVEILWEFSHYHTRTVGEVLHASPQGVALMNARIEHRQEQATPGMSKLPYLGRLYKNSIVGARVLPVEWVPILHMTTARVLTPPPEGYVAPQLAINTQDGQEFERIGIDFDFNMEEEWVYFPPHRIEPVTELPTANVR